MQRSQKRFNSLRTGRHIQSCCIPRSNDRNSKEAVSIPYEREGISKEHPFTPQRKKVNLLFQFPTNGKAYPKGSTLLSLLRKYTVSIPYEREGISKEEYRKIEEEVRKQFQFPTNGKAYPKTTHPGWGLVWQCHSFNSLRTGRHIQSKPCPAKLLNIEL